MTFHRATSIFCFALLCCLSSKTWAQDSATPEPAPVDPSMVPITVQDKPPEKRSTKNFDSDKVEPERAVEAPKGPEGFEKYNRPLFFSPEDNKVQITSPQIRWDLSGGTRINLGGLLFEESSIRIVVDQFDREGLPKLYRGDGTGPKTTNISFAWPSFMVRTGRLTIESLQGKVVWSTEVDEDMREEWLDLFERDKEAMRLKAHAKSPWGMLDVDLAKHPFLANGAKFRFCLSKQTDESEGIRLCSAPHMVQNKNGAVQIVAGTENVKATVYIGKEEVGPNARINFPPGKKISLKVVFRNGSFVQLSSRPLEVRFLDVVSSKDGKSIILTGRGPKPIGQVEDLEIPANHFWSATGILKEIVWKITVPVELPIIRVFGAWSVPFTYLVRYKDLPREEDRVFIHKRTGSGTYVDGAWVYAYSPSGAKLSSNENKVIDTGDGFYRWDFRAKNKGQANDSRLIITEPGVDGKKWIAHYETYRGYSYELSGRLTGIVDATLATAVIGEVAATKWFERIAGVRSYLLSEKRWGISARYFKALTPFSLQEGVNSPFAVMNANLHYNVIPGIWNRDELFGLIFGYQSVDLATMKGRFLGGGLYWARTMPKIFDDLFNIIPLLRYPKYVDVEFIAYPMTLDDFVEPGLSYNLNFHGKVFWNRRFYGEAGFGIKTFDYVDNRAGLKITEPISTLYGTVGLGLVF